MSKQIAIYETEQAINNNLNTGIELSVNDIIYFGVGMDVYADKKFCIENNIEHLDRQNNVYCTPIDLTILLTAIYEVDGFLHIS